MRAILSKFFASWVDRGGLRMARKGGRPGPALVMTFAALWAVAGCDSLSFTPEKPPELASPATATSAAARGTPAPATTSNSTAVAPSQPARSAPAARLIELILSQPPDVDRLYLEQFLRRDAGVKKFAFRSVKPEKSGPMSPASLTQAIRAATSRGGAIIVEPIDAPEVRRALDEAAAKGVSIVLLDTAVPSSSSGKPHPRLTFGGFAGAGKKVVEGALDEAKLMGFPADGKIILTHTSPGDGYSDRRFRSLADALEAAGRTFEVLPLDTGDGQSDKVLAMLRSHPNTIIILFDDDYGLAAAHFARKKWVENGHREIVLAGYAACDIRLDIIVKGKAAALVDRNIEGYSRKALQLAIDQVEGRPVPEVTELEVTSARNHRLFYPVNPESKEAGPTSGTTGDKPAAASSGTPKSSG
jgi:ABC-type sugar transport system substrate-binding protein